MTVSIVIPVRDEAATIGRTLDDLLAQSRRPDQIVFVDAGSRDGTADVIAAHALARTMPVRVVRADAAYPGRARNLGVAASEGDWVAFTDAGVRLAPSWLETLVDAAAADPAADAIAGDWDLDVASPFGRCLAMSSAPTERPATGGLRRPPAIFSLLLRRAAWDRVGPFREDLRSAEDRLFLQRLFANGRVIRAQACCARWRPPETLRAAWRRYRTYARHNMRAGLFREWQAPLLGRYAVVVAGTIALSVWTPLAGALGGMLLWILLLTARAAKALYANRGDRHGLAQNAADLARLVPLLALLDTATAAGTFDWLRRDAGRPAA